MNELVLSLFPGIGLLDMAFEEEGFTVVRGPDLLWGGDIRSFHPPAGKFDGVIGGPPCQAFSALKPLADKSRGYPAPNLIPEFERVVGEARPDWFVMENVMGAPLPFVKGYLIRPAIVLDIAVGGETSRQRRFSFGILGNENRFVVDELALHRQDAEPAVIASNGGPSSSRKAGGAIRKSRGAKQFPAALKSQGLPDDFLALAPFTAAGKTQAIGNGVPLPMGRAVAKAVKRALGIGEAV
jgi:DNA (cytosine-5)-methyltransferase 1